MNLRAQMLLAGALTLLVPIVGWQSVRELDASLRAGRSDTQRLTMSTLALSLGELPVVAARSPVELRAELSRAPIVVDGYADDWAQLGRPSLRLTGNGTGVRATTLEIRAAVRGRRLFLLIDADDDARVAHRPPRLRSDAGEGELPDTLERLARGDALQLLLLDGPRRVHALVSAIAPGDVPVRVASPGRDARGRSVRTGDVIGGWRAAWSERPGGHRIELSLPLPDASAPRLALGFVDVDRLGTGASWLGTSTGLAMRRLHAMTHDADDASLAVPRLYLPAAALQRQLERTVPPGARARLFDRVGRLLADTDRLNVGAHADEAGPFDSLLDAILFRVFAFLVAGDLPLSERRSAPDVEPALAPRGIDPAAPSLDDLVATDRYVTPSLDRVLGTLLPLGEASDASPTGSADGEPVEGPDGGPNGWLWYESNEEHSAAFTGSRLARLFSLMLLASLLASLLLFAWATWLSLRIRRIASGAAAAVAPDGRSAVRFSPSDAGDELGALSRDLGALLERSAGYERYLEALAARLSHELRTPLSVVRTSLEHLLARAAEPSAPGGADADVEQSTRLLRRAAGGADELDALLRALIRSTRLEQTLERAEIERLDIDAFLDDCRERYAQLHPAFQVTIERDARPRGGRAARTSCSIDVAPDLLVQALDKLVENAVDYASRHELTLLRRLGQGARIDQVLIAVGNPTDDAVADGPDDRPPGDATADDRYRHWFDPMSSERAGGEARHLGLGLHLVALLARRQRGEAVAWRERDRTLVGLWLPLADDA